MNKICLQSIIKGQKQHKRSSFGVFVANFRGVGSEEPKIYVQSFFLNSRVKS